MDFSENATMLNQLAFSLGYEKDTNRYKVLIMNQKGMYIQVN